MRLYRFDGVIYAGNPVRQFYIFCLKRHPKALLALPLQLAALLRYWFGSIGRADFWQRFHAYLRYIPDAEAEITAFWSDERLKHIKKAYRQVAQPTDIASSDAPLELISPACHHLGIHHILAPHMDLETGSYPNGGHYAMEQARALAREQPEETLERFWSDRLTDEPLALLALERKILCGEQLFDWDTYQKQESRRKRWRRIWLTPEMFRFWCVGWANFIITWLLEVTISRHLLPNIAFALGYGAGLLVSFVLNSKITFKAPLSWQRLLPFLISYLPNFLVQYATVLLFYNLLHWPHQLVYIIAVWVGTPVTFFCLRHFAFRQEKK